MVSSSFEFIITTSSSDSECVWMSESVIVRHTERNSTVRAREIVK